MEIEKNYFLICENAILDLHSKLTVINIFEILNTKSLPVTIGRFFMVLNLTVKNPLKSDSKLTLAIGIKSPSGKNIDIKLGTIEKEIDISNNHQNIGFLVDVNNFVFNEFGIYKFIATINQKNVAFLNLEVKQEKI